MFRSDRLHMLFALVVSLAIQGGFYVYCLETLAG